MNRTSPTDKLLFTPGPLTTSLTVKQAMLRDLGSRDAAFIRVVEEIRERLLAIGQVSKEAGYEAIPMQGSGTFGIEATLGSVIHRGGKLLVVINGAYGARIQAIAERLEIECVAMRVAENTIPSAEQLHETLLNDVDITDVAVVHCETTTGIMNPVEELGQVVHELGRTYIVDAMSSFGAVPLDLAAARIDYLISSANKCIEGVPGFSFVIANRANLMAGKGSARSMSLDLYAQWESLEKSGQFCFTPPTHTMLAFLEALQELDGEGGVIGRAKRYRENHVTLIRGMRELGFREYIDPELQGWIITAFRYPEDPAFQFEEFYEQLSQRGMLIYPGKLTAEECFRIGNIGRIAVEEMNALLTAIRETLAEMRIRVPV
ncbi:MAG: 2-aminoethylphosphonate-pyruvate transaminase [Limisphaerales bacterium]|jgi:2-aminoethylphosphonate-pyruvate transaminase